MITFKQFLAESAPSPRNVDGQFNVANVSFDNENGMGATPNNANVMYMGAVAWMKPSVFRRLAAAADRGGDAQKLEKLMRDGKAIGTPFLRIDVIGDDISSPTSVKVVGHEGRARADAFVAINGDVPMPVHLFPVGLRARDLSPAFFAWIEKNGLAMEKSVVAVKPHATMYYCAGDEIKA